MRIWNSFPWLSHCQNGDKHKSRARPIKGVLVIVMVVIITINNIFIAVINSSRSSYVILHNINRQKNANDLQRTHDVCSFLQYFIFCIQQRRMLHIFYAAPSRPEFWYSENQIIVCCISTTKALEKSRQNCKTMTSWELQCH